MINYDIWCDPQYWTDIYNYVAGGDPSPSVPIGQLGVRTIKDTYSYSIHDTIVLDFAEPYDTTCCIWGVDPSAALAHKAAAVLGGDSSTAIIEIANSAPEVTAPLLVAATRGFGSADFCTISPQLRYQYEQDNINDMPGITTVPLMSINPTRWAILPQVSLIRFSEKLQSSTPDRPYRVSYNSQYNVKLSDLKAAIRSYSECTVCQLDLGVFYCGSDQGQRTLNNAYFGYQADTTMICDTVSDIRLPQRLINYAKTHNEYGGSDPILPAAYAEDKILQAPFTRYAGTSPTRIDQAGWMTWLDNYEVMSSWRSVRPPMQIGYYLNLTVNNYKAGVHYFYKVSPVVHEFDDVSYHWATRTVHVYDEAGETFVRDIQDGEDLTAWTGGTQSVRSYSYLVIDDQKDAADLAEAIYRAILHECAYAGFYFAETEATAKDAILGSDTQATDLYLPEFSASGTTTGRYYKGSEIADAPNADYSSNFDYDYDPHYDPNPGEDDIGDFRTRINSGSISAGTIYYAVSDTEFKDLIRYLNTTYNPDEQELAEDFKGVNPFDYIISAKYYPFPLPYAVAQSINVGPLATGVTGYIMPYTYGNSSYSYFDMGSWTFTPYFENFLDYSATQIQLFLPWCGVVNLDPAVWIAPPGRTPITMRIRYSFDYVTGSVTAFIFRDGGRGEFLIDTADGTAGIDVPLSLYATGTYQQQISQASTAYKLAATSRFGAFLGVVGGMAAAGLSAAMGNPLGIVGGVGATLTSVNKLNQTEIQADAASYTLDHTLPNLGSVSAASPFNAAVMDQRPFILITRPRYQHTLPTGWEVSYARTVGYACTIPTILSNPRVRGYAVVQSPRLEGIKKSIGTPPKTYTPTEQELAMIRQHMAAGIIL